MLMVPREHGAYSQMALPLLTSLVTSAGITWPAVLTSLAVVLGFLAHEDSCCSVDGERGARAESAPRARKALAVSGGAIVRLRRSTQRCVVDAAARGGGHLDVRAALNRRRVAAPSGVPRAEPVPIVGAEIEESFLKQLRKDPEALFIGQMEQASRLRDGGRKAAACR
jgi:hypothetical protein